MLTKHELDTAEKYITYRKAHEVIHEELQIFEANECHSQLTDLWCAMLERTKPKIEEELAGMEYRYIRLRITDDPTIWEVFIGDQQGTIEIDLKETRRSIEEMVRRWGVR